MAERRDSMAERLKGVEPEEDDVRLRRRLDRGWLRLEAYRHDVAAEREQRLGWRDSIILSTAGMRGVVTIAAAQTLPRDHPLYATLILVSFVVALATLLPQGLLLPVLVRRLRPTADPDDTERREFAELLGRMSEAAREAIEEQLEVEEIDPVVAEGFEAWLRERARRAEVLGELRSAELAAQFRRVREAQLAAEAQALAAERWRGRTARRRSPARSVPSTTRRSSSRVWAARTEAGCAAGSGGTGAVPATRPHNDETPARPTSDRSFVNTLRARGGI